MFSIGFQYATNVYLNPGDLPNYFFVAMLGLVHILGQY